MARTIGDRLKHAWNAFQQRDDSVWSFQTIGGSYYRPDRPRFSRGNERSIVTSIYNRIAIDCAAINFQHARLDDDNRFIETINSGLNQCLNVEANIDQTGRSFLQDIVMSMLDEGVIAMVPVEASFNPKITGSYDILSMRRGKIVQWYPQHVRLQVYNEKTGQLEEILMPKSTVAIIENPLYAVMNEPNSTLQRLIRKLNILDVIDEESGSKQFNMIIQLPYTVNTELRKNQAAQRRAEIEDQLSNSKYGIAYTGATEHITQLSRPLENNLMSQIEYLTKLLDGQLGLTPAVMDGTADEKEMLNYYSRTIEPICAAMVDEMNRTFLTKTARSQKQSIVFFKDPFKLVPVLNLAEIADKMTRNEIMTSNEIRQIVGMKPSDDLKADQLVNSNLNQPGEEGSVQAGEEELNPMMSDPNYAKDYDEIVNELFSDLESQIAEITKKYGGEAEEKPESDGDG